MSEQKKVSPLLDGFAMGEAMSSHDGVSCYPAMKENSEEKYIVKIISVPASQKQLDALLLTGAYKDAAAATEYFKELADGIVKEAKLLQQLSKLEGFLSYEGWQVVPMEDNKLGYEVCLVGSYKRSLEKYLRRNTMTHLGAVNLGLDLCAALSVLRRAGFMHVDLKPSNIFLTGEREYRIGDLGFAKLSSLKYSSLSSKYISCYTPPELHDVLATLNPTADIYAVGLILYQIYNNGVLPFDTHAPAEALPAPMNADYEMAEIILKACHPNPRHRWQTPIEMGQALVSYMQRNSVNDVPILPPVATPAEDSTEEAEESAEDEQAPVIDETIPSAEDSEELSAEEMTNDGSELLSQANELIEHEIPTEDEYDDEDEYEDEEDSEDEDDEDEEEDDEEDVKKAGIPVLRKIELDDEDDDDYDDDDDEDEEPVAREVRPGKKKSKGWIGAIIIVLLLALIGGAGYYYYSNYYLLPIDNMEIGTFEDTITVNITTAVDESMLSVVCTDTYGNTVSQPISNGQAVFTKLNPDTTYEITVVAEGLHKASNSYFGSCSTAKQTEIVDFAAKTGTEDGSVILSFTVNGPEPQDWLVEYSAEDEEAQSVSFTGHMVSVSGLTLDKSYTFDLIPAVSDDEWIVGTTTLEYTASRLVVAEDLKILSGAEGSLIAQWNTPADTAVSSWTVRCYSENGYDETLTVSENTAEFTGIDTSVPYTMEVTAAGMTQSARAFVTANPTKISAISVDTSTEDQLTVSWDYDGSTPEGGWLLMYSVNGGDSYEVVKCTDASGVISLRIPKAIYQLSIEAADGSTVFGGTMAYTCPDAPDFSLYYLTASDIMVSLCHTPSKTSWTYHDIDEYPSTYAVGDKISMVIYATKKVSEFSEDIQVTYIIRDSEGNVLQDLMTTETENWYHMWNGRYAYLDIPAVPAEAGSYTVDLYFNGGFALSKSFNITE